MRVSKWIKVSSVIMALVICCMFAMQTQTLAATGNNETVEASNNGRPIERWTHTSSVMCGMSFSNNNAICSVAIDGYAGTTGISATYDLQQYINGSYKTIKSWSASTTRTYLDWGASYAVTSGYTYRLYVTSFVTRNGTTEQLGNYVTATLY